MLIMARISSVRVDDSGNDAPNVLAGCPHKRSQYKLLPFLPPDDKVAVSRIERSVYNSQVTIKNAVAVPVVAADAKEVGTAGVLYE